MTAARSKRGLSCGTVALGMAALVVLAAAAGVWGYFRFLHFTPVAARHVPPGAVAVARVDVKEGILYDPVRQHLVPVLMEVIGREAPDSAMRRFEAATGLERKSLREIVVARGAGWEDWTLVLGGLFPKDAVSRIQSTLQAEGHTDFTRQPGTDLLVHGLLGVAIAQAADGALILGSHADAVRAALPEQDTARALGLDLDAPAAFAASAEPLREVARHPVARLAPGLGDLTHVERLRGAVHLGNPFEIRIHLDPRPGVPVAELRAGTARLLGALQLVSRLTPGTDLAGERTILERAVVAPDGSDFVTISSSWTREEVDRGARSLAEALRGWLGAAPARR
jgi:hypothetical protein